MYRIIRNILFLFDAERAHHFACGLARFTIRIPLLRSFLKPKKKEDQSVKLMGLSFKNRVGLAAGFDKNAENLSWLSHIGFSFIEVGTTTPLAQKGNPKPRLFRLKKDQAIINRMGFNNKGVQYLKQMLTNKPSDIVIGGNIGKNKNTPNSKALDDYLFCFKTLENTVDYFVVNVSSPNTKNLRELQENKALKAKTHSKRK